MKYSPTPLTARYPAGLHSKLNLVRQGLRDIYPGGGCLQGLVSLCVNKIGVPHGCDHADLLAEFAGVRLQASERDLVAQSYIYLAAYYFLLDAVTDGHLNPPENAAHLTQLFFAFERCLHKLFPDSEFFSRYVSPILAEHFSANANAVLGERELFKYPLDPKESQDEASAIARSNSFTLFYKLICLAGGSRPSAEALNFLDRFIYSVQLADDFTDWEEDYQAGRFTSFIRQCFQHSGKPASFEELTEIIYFGGLYEFQLGLLIGRFNELADGLRNMGLQKCERISAFIDWNIQSFRSALNSVLILKLKGKVADVL